MLYSRHWQRDTVLVCQKVTCYIGQSSSHFVRCSLNWPTGPIPSLSLNLRLCVLCVSVPLFLFFKLLITPIYKGWTSNWSFTKRYERALVSELAILAKKGKKLPCRMVFLFRLCFSLLMDLGQNQQQHPTVHSEVWELAGSPSAPVLLPFRSLFAAPLPLPFRSPSAPLGNWTNQKISRFLPLSIVFTFTQPCPTNFGWPITTVFNQFQLFSTIITVLNRFQPSYSVF